MKYNLKEHPYIFMLLAALILLAGSIVLAYFYNWSIYSIIAIVIAGLGSAFLLYSFIYDLILFKKNKKENK